MSMWSGCTTVSPMKNSSSLTAESPSLSMSRADVHEKYSDGALLSRGSRAIARISGQVKATSYPNPQVMQCQNQKSCGLEVRMHRSCRSDGRCGSEQALSQGLLQES